MSSIPGSVSASASSTRGAIGTLLISHTVITFDGAAVSLCGPHLLSHISRPMTSLINGRFPDSLGARAQLLKPMRHLRRAVPASPLQQFAVGRSDPGRDARGDLRVRHRR